MQTLIRTFMNWRLPLIFSILFMGLLHTVLACSPPPPMFDPNGRRIEHTFDYQFRGVVTGSTEVEARQSVFPLVKAKIPGITVRVTHASTAIPKKGESISLITFSIGGDCGRTGRPLTLAEFPIGSEVRFVADELPYVWAETLTKK